MIRSTRVSARWRARGALALSLAAAALAAAPPIEYPPAPRREVVDDFHGTPVADPHRGLEDAADPGTATWLAAEQELTASVLGALPRRAEIRRRLEELSLASSSTEVPWREGGRLFYVATDGRAQQPVLYEEQASGAARAVVDPNRISPDGAIAVGDFVVSPDAVRVAFRMARGGEDLGEVRVWEVDGGRDLGESIPGVSNLGSWLPDASGFFYVRPATSAPGGARSGKQIVMHRLGRPASEDVVVHVFPGAAARWAYCMTSANGRWALFVAEKGSESELVVLELEGDGAAGPRSRRFTLLAGRGGFHTPLDFAGDTLFVRTNLDAPRGRVVALDLRAAEGAAPRPVVAETAETLENAAIAGDRLVLHYLVDVESRLRLHALDGAPAGEIALPGPGAVGWPLSARPGSPELHYAFASYLAPSTVYRCDVRTRNSTPFRAPRVPFDADAYETRQVFVASPDGTRVPMFVTAAKGLARRGERPAFLTAYGGYGASLQPAYDPEIPLWLEMGGVYAVANLRGGGEYGEAWHRGGMLERKQSSFDDFYAAARFLVSEGYAAPGRLAIYGHSNGGLLIGAAITQRPQLFAAAVANAGHYDMLRFHRFNAGAAWVSEYGSPDEAAAFRWLRAYSPLHNVRTGACYPATLLLAADHDDRVVPGHSYKFAAALQQAQGCDRPVLLRVAKDASHSYASRDAFLDERADMWAFIAAHTGASLVAR